MNFLDMIPSGIAIPSSEELAQIELREQAERERQRLAEQARFFRQRVASCGLPITSEDIDRLVSGHAQQTQAYREVHDWMGSTIGDDGRVSQTIRYPWLVLLGGVGVGKTFAAASFAIKANAKYIRFDQAARLCASKWSPDREKFESLFEVPDLVIDELGTETDADAGRLALLELVEWRRRDKQRTLLMGNLRQVELKQKFDDGIYDPRVRSRFQQCAVLRVIQGGSMRPSGKESGW